MRWNSLTPTVEHILQIASPVLFHEVLPYAQRLRYEQMDLQIRIHIIMNNFSLTRESQEADDARSRRLQDKRKEWISTLQVGDILTICMHENVGEKSCDARVESINDGTIHTRIINTENNHHLTEDTIMRFSQANWAWIYDEVYYTIENPQTYLEDGMNNLLWTTQLEVDIPPYLLRKRNNIRRIIGDPKNNTMTIKGVKYTVVQKLDGWNVIKHENGILGLCAVQLDDYYGDIEF